VPRDQRGPRFWRIDVDGGAMTFGVKKRRRRSKAPKESFAEQIAKLHEYVEAVNDAVPEGEEGLEFLRKRQELLSSKADKPAQVKYFVNNPTRRLIMMVNGSVYRG